MYMFLNACVFPDGPRRKYPNQFRTKSSNKIKFMENIQKQRKCTNGGGNLLEMYHKMYGTGVTPPIGTLLKQG